MSTPCFIGLDLGTSGCRAVAITPQGLVVCDARVDIPGPRRIGTHGVEQDPGIWWGAVTRVLRQLAGGLGSHRAAACCLDGTSASLLLCDPNGNPLAPALMYNDARSIEEAEMIEGVAPADSAARGAGSSLAKALHLARRLDPPPGSLALHQADWLTGRLTGRFGVSDWNNALKLGYDAAGSRWPDWISRLRLGQIELPRVYASGTRIGSLSPDSARETGLPVGMPIAVGTTDSTAAVIATGARSEGTAVTSLGSTLVLKVIATTPVSAPEFGVYSHRLGRLWLVGGASNSGGAVLRRFFDDAQVTELSRWLRPDAPTGLGYYPLPAPGERFPIRDPDLPPRLSPRPSDDVRFLQGLLEGIAAIEAEGYKRLRYLGAPAPTRVISIGGGAANSGWTDIRQRLLGVPVSAAANQDAAFGSALLARGSVTGSVP